MNSEDNNLSIKNNHPNKVTGVHDNTAEENDIKSEDGKLNYSVCIYI